MRNKKSNRSFYKSLASLAMVLMFCSSTVSNLYFTDTGINNFNSISQVDFGFEIEEYEYEESALDKVKTSLLINKLCDPDDIFILASIRMRTLPHYPDTPTPPPEHYLQKI